MGAPLGWVPTSCFISFLRSPLREAFQRQSWTEREAVQDGTETMLACFPSDLDSSWIRRESWQDFTVTATSRTTRLPEFVSTRRSQSG